LSDVFRNFYDVFNRFDTISEFAGGRKNRQIDGGTELLFSDVYSRINVEA